MLVEWKLVEQRYRAVSEVLVEGVTLSEVATLFGVSRQSVHAWLRRYAGDGMPGLVDRSCWPDRCPHQTPAELEVVVIATRREHPASGPRRILVELDRVGLARLPGRSTIYRILVRNHLIDPQRRRKRRRDDYRRWERSGPMDTCGREGLASGYRDRHTSRRLD
jgi:transposase-like protein